MSEAIELRVVKVVKTAGLYRASKGETHQIIEGTGYGCHTVVFSGSLIDCHRIKNAYMTTGLYEDQTADDINDMERGEVKVVSVKGRYPDRPRLRVTASGLNVYGMEGAYATVYREEDGTLSVRIDDRNNPEFWMEVVISD